MQTTEYEKLQDFLSKPSETYEPEDLHRKILARRHNFYAAGLLESGEPSNRLAAPSGPENVQLGLVKHSQSKEGEIGEFWDIESWSIQILAEKGLGKELMLGFDWQWRGEIVSCNSTSTSGQTACDAPPRTWISP